MDECTHEGHRCLLAPRWHPCEPQGPVILQAVLRGAERKDTTLSGKLVQNAPVRWLHGEAFIELKEGAKPKKQRPYENHGKKHEILRDIIQRNLREFGWLEACMTSEWCCASFTVPKPPTADQISIDGWRMVVDFHNLNAETKADSQPLPLIEEEIVKRA